MAFRWLKSVFGLDESSWPADIPRLFPDLGVTELCTFLPDEDYRRLKRTRPVLVLPLTSARSSEQDRYFGMALSRILIRDLMVVPSLSVRGPEDTRPVPLEDWHEDDKYLKRHVALGGEAHILPEGFIAELTARHPDGGEDRQRVQGSDLQRFIAACAAAAAGLLDQQASGATSKKWGVGRPRLLSEFLQFGQLCIAPEDAARTEQVTRMWRRNTSFALPLHLLDCYDIRSAGAPVQEILQLGEEGIQNDPEDPTLYTRMIDACMDQAEYHTALRFARQAQKLFEPMSERTRYCLEQNPENARRLRQGEWDPAADMDRLVQILRRLSAKQR
jgi:hypothetical protein